MTTDPHASQPIVQAGTSLARASGVMILTHGRGGSAADIFEFRSRPCARWIRPPRAPSRRSHLVSLLISRATLPKRTLLVVGFRSRPDRARACARCWFPTRTNRVLRLLAGRLPRDRVCRSPSSPIWSVARVYRWPDRPAGRTHQPHRKLGRHAHLAQLRRPRSPCPLATRPAVGRSPKRHRRYCYYSTLPEPPSHHLAR